jgi:hypothetical protein
MLFLDPRSGINIPDPQHCWIQNNCVPTPGGVDLVPIHRDRGQATQPEPINCAKVSRVPNVKRGIEHVRFLQLLQLALGGAQLGVQASILVLGLQQLVLVPAVLTPVVLLLMEQYRYMVAGPDPEGIKKK